MIVTFNKKFAKDLQSIQDSKLKSAIKDFILRLEVATQLEGIGDYRIGFYYENNQIELVRVVKRNDIYKVFP
jgi:mRNA-degrading endonuclease RelE of RelBE toxin-antitoxin system